MHSKFFMAAAVSLVFAATASATPIFDPTTSKCTGRNCSAIELGGTVNGFLQSAMPWVIEVYAAARECLRIEVTSQEADLEMRLVAPDASRTWISDDSALAPCPLCPRIAIGTGQHEGWFTVQVSEFGGASVQANFTLAYGRYNRGNPNCTGDTLAPAATIDKGSASPAPDPASAPGR